MSGTHKGRQQGGWIISCRFGQPVGVHGPVNKNWLKDLGLGPVCWTGIRQTRTSPLCFRTYPFRGMLNLVPKAWQHARRFPRNLSRASGCWLSAQQSSGVSNEQLSLSVCVYATKTLYSSGPDLHTDLCHGLLVRHEEAEPYQLAHSRLVQFSGPRCWWDLIPFIEEERTSRGFVYIYSIYYKE